MLKMWLLDLRERTFSSRRSFQPTKTGHGPNAQLTKPDAVDRTNPAVDKLATRADGRTLAIDHTVIEPFTGDKEDFAEFENVFLAINNDRSLAVRGRRIKVFVPVGTLHKQPKIVRDAIAKSVHDWIRSNRLAIIDGNFRTSMRDSRGRRWAAVRDYTHSQIRSF